MSLPDDLAATKDGVSVTRTELQGVFTYEVRIDADELAALPDSMDAKTFAEKIAASRLNTELEPTFKIDSSDAFAQTMGAWNTDGEKFTVVVRFSQSE